jgi:hypothetical protein
MRRERVPGLLDGRLGQIPPVVGAGADRDVVQHIDRAADVVGVGMRDPQEVDRLIAEIAGQTRHHALVPRLARRAAARPRRGLARVDHDVLAIR